MNNFYKPEKIGKKTELNLASLYNVGQMLNNIIYLTTDHFLIKKLIFKINFKNALVRNK